MSKGPCQEFPPACLWDRGQARGRPGVVVLSGSSGRIDRARARILADAGAVALAVGYFGGPGHPPGICEVSLETITAAVDALVDLGCSPIGIVGTSKGAEAALLVAQRHPMVGAVVAPGPDLGGVGERRARPRWVRPSVAQLLDLAARAARVRPLRSRLDARPRPGGLPWALRSEPRALRRSGEASCDSHPHSTRATGARGRRRRPGLAIRPHGFRTGFPPRPNASH